MTLNTLAHVHVPRSMLRSTLLSLLVVTAARAQVLSPEALAELTAQTDAKNQAARDAALAREGLARLTLSGEVVHVPVAAASEWKYLGAERTLISPVNASCKPALAFVTKGNELWALEEQMELPYTKQEVQTRCGPPKPAPPNRPVMQCRVVGRFKVPSELVWRGVRVVKAPYIHLVTSCAAESATPQTVPPPSAPSAPAAAPPAPRFCDRAHLACKQPEVACEAGMTSIDNDCFGACVPVTACACDARHACPKGARCVAGRCQR